MLADPPSGPVRLLDRPGLGWIRERDIDLLLCAELHAAGPLRDLFAEHWPGRTPVFEGAWVSHSDSDGESDLVVQFRDGALDLVLLVENKIGAAFQPDQPQRYAARAHRLRERGGADVRTLLIAPQDYLAGTLSEPFDHRLPYERVASRLAEAPDPRSRFLGRCLEDGIALHRRGYQMVVDAVVSDLWAEIWRMASSEAPDLLMPRPTEKPGGSGWVYFNRPRGFTAEDARRCVIAWKASRGQADLQFAAMDPGDLRQVLAGVPLPAGGEIVKAGKSASLRVPVPVVDFGRPADGQREAILEGLRVSARLRRLYLDHRIGERLASRA